MRWIGRSAGDANIRVLPAGTHHERLRRWSLPSPDGAADPPVCSDPFVCFVCFVGQSFFV
jgi:hypothetical protein